MLNFVLRSHEDLLESLGGGITVKSVLTAMEAHYPTYFQALQQAILKGDEAQTHALRHKVLGTLSLVADEKSDIFNLLEKTRQLEQADKKARIALVKSLEQQEKHLLREITQHIESLS